MTAHHRKVPNNYLPLIMGADGWAAHRCRDRIPGGTRDWHEHRTTTPTARTSAHRGVARFAGRDLRGGLEGVRHSGLRRRRAAHHLLNGRFGSKAALWYATVDWAFQPLVMRLATAFDPTLTDPLDQLRITMRTFLLYSAERPELNGLMNIEGRQDTERLAYLYDTYIGPSLAPVERLLKFLADSGRIRPVSLRTLHFMLAHGAAAPFTLDALARQFDDVDPLDPAEVEAHVDLAVDLLIRALEIHDSPPKKRSGRK
jgi:TetR/AcrR family transcriptional regulator